MKQLFILLLSAASILCHADHNHNAVRRHYTTAHTEQKRSERVRALFNKRATNATYPTMDVTGPTPKSSWMTAYQQVVAAGLIPNISASMDEDSWPVYPTSVNSSSETVCNFALTGCTTTEDIVDAPSNYIGISFDDGPSAPSYEMYNFLSAKHIPSTHFMIGSRVVEYPDEFQQVYTMGGHLAVHTWSHPLCTTLNDSALIGELGWTIQVIYDYSGVVPRFWRPPYGDVDNRVRAIAKHVFGLTTVLWNQDSKDWCLSDDGTNGCVGDTDAGPKTDAGLLKELKNWYRGSQSPGLIILEHEHHNRSITGFIDAYPTLVAQNWTVKNIPDLFSDAWYLNAADNTTTPVSMSIGAGYVSALPSAASQFDTASAASQSASASAAAGSGVSSKSHATGWNKLSSTAHWAIIGSAAGVGALLVLALLLFCCIRRHKKNRANQKPKSGNGRISIVQDASAAFRKSGYQQFDISSPAPTYHSNANDVTADSFGEKEAYSLHQIPAPAVVAAPAAAPTESRRMSSLPATSTASAPAPGLTVPQAEVLRHSAVSVYSQSSNPEDPFAARPLALSASRDSTSTGATRKSAFHLPNRFEASPYRHTTTQKNNWI